MPKSLTNFLKKLGPGLITGASDDDPSGIATYSQAGAQFGLATLWMTLVTFPLMVSIQEMSARIGMITSKGLIANIDQHYPRFITHFILCLIFPAIILNIGADISAMGAVANLMIPKVPALAFSIFFTFSIIIFMVEYHYLQIARILKFLCLSLFLYVLVPFFVQKDNLAIIKHTFIPHVQFNKEFIGILVAILGTTISPYLFFWQATMEAEEHRHHKKKISLALLKDIRIDVAMGILFSNMVMYFITLTAGTVLFAKGSSIQTVEQAARALEPVAGSACYFLFSLGIIGTGLLAIPVLSGTLAYLYSTTFHKKEGLDKKFYQAKAFYVIFMLTLLFGLLINFMNVNPIHILVYSAMLYGILSPPLILIILLLANNKKLLGKHTNGRWSNIFGTLTLLIMTSGVICFFVL